MNMIYQIMFLFYFCLSSFLLELKYITQKNHSYGNISSKVEVDIMAKYLHYVPSLKYKTSGNTSNLPDHRDRSISIFY